MSTGGRSATSFLLIWSLMPSCTSVTALIGIATSLCPQRWPSASSTCETRRLATSHLNLTLGDGVVGHGLRDPRHVSADDAAGLPAVQAVVGPRHHLLRTV